MRLIRLRLHLIGISSIDASPPMITLFVITPWLHVLSMKERPFLHSRHWGRR
jgi:hypothetical protein